jgi:hypothetical protein
MNASRADDRRENQRLSASGSFISNKILSTVHFKIWTLIAPRAENADFLYLPNNMGWSENKKTCKL